MIIALSQSKDQNALFFLYYQSHFKLNIQLNNTNFSINKIFYFKKINIDFHNYLNIANSIFNLKKKNKVLIEKQNSILYFIYSIKFVLYLSCVLIMKKV